MTTPTAAPETPKEKARRLLASYATKKAALNEATAPFERQVKELQEALVKATTLIECELENMEAELKLLALDHGADIFGPASRSLTESGHILQLRSTESVECENEEEAIRELLRLSRTAKTMDAQVAALACLRTKTELDREYIGKHYAAFAEWFNVFGIVVVTKDSASIKAKPAPKPKAAKKPKAPKAETLTQEAA